MSVTRADLKITDEVNIAGTDVERLNAIASDAAWFKEYLLRQIEDREKAEHVTQKLENTSA